VSWKAFLSDRALYDPIALRVLKEGEARRNGRGSERTTCTAVLDQKSDKYFRSSSLTRSECYVQHKAGKRA
jgi:hypothetical protein